MDRKKDKIVTGGFNVYPREVEDVLMTDPAVAIAAVIAAPDEKWGEAVTAVAIAAVIAAPDEKWGEAVTAVVVAKDGREIDEADLLARVRARKGPVHTPKRLDVVDALPLTPLGKPDKKALRARNWAGRDRQVG